MKKRKWGEGDCKLQDINVHFAKTNPTAEKIMIVCEVLKVTPEWLLSGIEPQGKRGKAPKKQVVDLQTDTGLLIECYNSLDQSSQAHLLGYAMGLKKMMEEKKGN